MNSITLSNAFNSSGENNKLVLQLSSNLLLENTLCCLDNLTIYYSWFNIKKSLNNNAFAYSDGGNIIDIILPDGSYEISDINKFLHIKMLENNLTNKKEKESKKISYPISLHANTTYYKVQAIIQKPFKLIIKDDNDFCKVIGMNPGTYSEDCFGQNIPNLENVESVFVHCNLVDNKYSTYSRLLYTFSPQKSKFGDLISVSPNFPRWVNCFNSSFNTIEIWFTSQDNKMLDIIDPKITITLLLKEKELTH